MYDNQDVVSIVSRLGAVLREPVGSCDISLLDSLRFDLLDVRVRWGAMLAEKKSQYLHPKDPTLTELDRKVMLNASLANIERDYEFLLGCEVLVESKINLWSIHAQRAE